jgi:hypothetical protein
LVGFCSIRPRRLRRWSSWLKLEMNSSNGCSTKPFIDVASDDVALRRADLALSVGEEVTVEAASVVVRPRFDCSVADAMVVVKS